MVKKMFTEIRSCNLMMYIFKGHVKIVKIYLKKNFKKKKNFMAPFYG